MQFDSLQQLVVMGGHGVYVWSAVTISVSVLIGLIIKPLRQHNIAIKNITRQLNLENAGQLAATQQEADDAPNS